MGNLHKNIQLSSEVPQGSILDSTLFLIYINDLPDDSTLSSKCDRASDLWQQLELHLNLNLTNETLNWGRKWLVNFNAGKTQLVSFDQSKNIGAIDVKMDGPVLEEKSSFINVYAGYWELIGIISGDYIRKFS